MRPIRTAVALLRQLFLDRRGTSAVEYGLMLALIVLAMFLGLTRFADVAVTMWKLIAAKVVAVS